MKYIFYFNKVQWFEVPIFLPELTIIYNCFTVTNAVILPFFWFSFILIGLCLHFEILFSRGSVVRNLPHSPKQRTSMFNTEIKKYLVFTNLKQTIFFLERDLCKTKSKPSQDITTVISESKLITESWHTNLKAFHTQNNLQTRQNY